MGGKSIQNLWEGSFVEKVQCKWDLTWRHCKINMNGFELGFISCYVGGKYSRETPLTI